MRRNLQANLIQLVGKLYQSIEVQELMLILDLSSIEELTSLCRNARIEDRFVILEGEVGDTDYQDESKIQLQILQQVISQIESLQSIEK